MKKIMMICAIALIAQFAQAEPAYTNGQWYVWTADYAFTATNCLGYINGSGWFPLTGSNAKTGEAEPAKQKTTSWATEVIELKDGRVGFPRIPKKVLDYLEIPEAEREAFWSAFKPEAVVVTEDMVKEE